MYSSFTTWCWCSRFKYEVPNINMKVLPFTTLRLLWDVIMICIKPTRILLSSMPIWAFGARMFRCFIYFICSFVTRSCLISLRLKFCIYFMTYLFQKPDGFLEPNWTDSANEASHDVNNVRSMMKVGVTIHYSLGSKNLRRTPKMWQCKTIPVTVTKTLMKEGKLSKAKQRQGKQIHSFAPVFLYISSAGILKTALISLRIA